MMFPVFYPVTVACRVSNTENNDEQETYKMATWGHSISEVITALIESGLSIVSFNEFDYSPYNCFENMTQRSEKEFIIEKYNYPIPLTYAIKALKSS